MGVKGLWQLMLPIGRRVSIETLEGKILAIDASIWWTQFVKAMRDHDDSGKVLPHAHIVGFLRRVCKLLYHGIRPVLVFDGPTPAIKLREIRRRRQLRDGLLLSNASTEEDKNEAAKKMAKRLLLSQMKKSKKTLQQRMKDNKNSDDGNSYPDSNTACAPGFNLVETDHQTHTKEELPSNNVVKSNNKPIASLKINSNNTKTDNITHLETTSIDDHSHNNINEDIIRNDSAIAQALQNEEYDTIDNNIHKDVITYNHEKEVKQSSTNILSFDCLNNIDSGLSEKQLVEDSNDDDSDHPLFDDIHEDVTASEETTYRMLNVDTVSSLSDGMRTNLFEQAKRDRRLATRHEILPLQNNPYQYSQAQLTNFLRSTRLNQKILELSQQVREQKQQEDNYGSKNIHDGGFLSNSLKSTKNDNTSSETKAKRKEEGKNNKYQPYKQKHARSLLNGSGGSVIHNNRNNLSIFHRGKSSSHKRPRVFFKEKDDYKKSKILGQEKTELISQDTSLGGNDFINSPSPHNDTFGNKAKSFSSTDKVEHNPNNDSYSNTSSSIIRIDSWKIGKEAQNITTEDCSDDDQLIKSKVKRTRLKSGDLQVDDKTPEGEGQILSLVNLNYHNKSKPEIVHGTKNSDCNNEQEKNCVETRKSNSTESKTNNDLPITTDSNTLDIVSHENEKKIKNNPSFVDSEQTLEMQRSDLIQDQEESDDNVDWEDGDDFSCHDETDVFATVTWEKKAKVNPIDVRQRETSEDSQNQLSLVKELTCNTIDAEEVNPTNYKPTSLTAINNLDAREIEKNYNQRMSSMHNVEGSDDGPYIQVESDCKSTVPKKNSSANVDKNMPRSIFEKEYELKSPKRTLPLQSSSEDCRDSRLNENDLNIKEETMSNDCLEMIVSQETQPFKEKRINVLEVSTVSAKGSDDVSAQPGNEKTSTNIMIGDSNKSLESNEHDHNFSEEMNKIQNEGLAQQKSFTVDLNSLEAEEEILRMEHNRLQRDTDDIGNDEMKEDIINLLKILGIPYIESPAEAEAQCVALEKMGLVDGIVTEDSDALVFGGKMVYKNIFDDRKYVEIYSCMDAEREMGLTRNEMVALAMLLGGDYTDGVKGVGIVNGMEVLQAFSVRNSVAVGLTSFRKWLDGFDPSDHISIHKLTGNKCHETPARERFHKKHRLARTRWTAPPNFPDPAVLKAYLNPVVDKSKEKFSWGTPDLDLIIRFCREKMGWLPEETERIVKPIIKRLEDGTFQTRMDSFLMKYSDGLTFANIRSERLRSVMNDIKRSKEGND